MPMLKFQSDIHDGRDASAGRDVVPYVGRNRVAPPSVASSRLYHVSCSVSCFPLISCSFAFPFFLAYLGRISIPAFHLVGSVLLLFFMSGRMYIRPVLFSLRCDINSIWLSYLSVERINNEHMDGPGY